MADQQQMVIDANTLIGGQVSGMTTAGVDANDIVSKAFTTVDQQEGVQYVTMTPEEAAAAGVMEDDQVVTTSLQFDPANPSVLYTADGTLINQSDLSPEEQALVQAALQQHLAEQEAEQQLQLIDQQGTVVQSGTETTTVTTVDASGNPVVQPTIISSDGQVITSQQLIQQQPTIIGSTAADPVANIFSETVSAASTPTTSVNLASPNTNAAQIVQTLANNVRRQQEYAKAQSLLQKLSTEKPSLPAGYRYEEKIILREGQPHVMKMPVKSTAPPPKKAELPDALRNLMPKVEIGKDGSQVIRIHQSQITADQLKSLQENPNVRLVFRPASSSRSRQGGYSKKRGGRPRGRQSIPQHNVRQVDDNGPPAKQSRYGRSSKAPYYSKDYSGDGPDDFGPVDEFDVAKQQGPPARRGRPAGSNRKGSYRQSTTYMNRMEALREQMDYEEEMASNAASNKLSIIPQKPVLSSVEQAISTRRKNRLRELLSACSEDEIMEVALPHLARVFSLWEFLIMKVEKNKLSRVYFADVYKEYESLHRYVTRLTEKYMDAIEMKEANPLDEIIKTPEELAKEDGEKKKVPVKCKKLAESLGLPQDSLEDALLDLLDAKPIIPPEPIPPPPVQQQQQMISVGDPLQQQQLMMDDLPSILKTRPALSQITSDVNNLIAVRPQPTIIHQEQLQQEQLQQHQEQEIQAIQQQQQQIQQEDHQIIPIVPGISDDVTNETTTTPAVTTDNTSVSIMGGNVMSSQITQPPTVATGNMTSSVDVTNTTSATGATSQSTGQEEIKEAESTTATTAEVTAVEQQPITETTETTSAVDTITTAAADPVVTAEESVVVSQQQQVTMETEQQQQVTMETAEQQPMEVEQSLQLEAGGVPAGVETTAIGETIVAASSGPQLIQIGTGDDKQFIEVPEGYTLIQTPNGLVMSQPGTQLTQDADGKIYVTQEDGTTAPLDAQESSSVPYETVESLLSLEGQQQQPQ